METAIWTRCRNVHQHVGRHLEEFCPGISGTGRSVKTHQMVTERELTERRRDKRTNQSKDSREDGGGGGRNTH